MQPRCIIREIIQFRVVCKGHLQNMHILYYLHIPVPEVVDTPLSVLGGFR